MGFSVYHVIVEWNSLYERKTSDRRGVQVQIHADPFLFFGNSYVLVF
jgi:hypothetical protein